MTWFAVDDSFHGHPKLAELERGKHFAAAVALWTVAGSWCAHHLTDGFVPEAQIRKLVPFNHTGAASELLRVGLWTSEPDGFRFKDWDDYQPTKTEVESKRAKAAARTRKSRNLARSKTGNAACNGVTASVTHSVSNGVGNGVGNAPPSRPVPSRPDLSPSGESPRASEPEPTPAAAAPVEAMVRSFAAPDPDHAETVRLVSETRVAAGGAPYRPRTWQDREAVSRLAEWSRSQANGEAATRLALVSFWAAKGTGASLRWMTEEDPGRWLGSVPRRSRPEHRPAKPNEAYQTDMSDLERALGVPNG